MILKLKIYIYNKVFIESNIDVTLKILKDKLNLISLNLQINDSNKKFNRIIEDPFFLYCNDELVLNYGDGFEVLVDKFYDICMEKYDDKSLDNFNRLTILLVYKIILYLIR